MQEIAPEDLRRIRRLQIQTTKQVEDLFAGAYHSAFKGRGLEFEEVREYMPGDDVRQIDWNVTARSQIPYIKNFREERELTVLLVVDISASSRFGSSTRLKSEMIAEIGAVLALSAIQNQDKVGLVLFSTEVELFLRPKKGLRHVLRVIRELLYFKPKYLGTDIGAALAFVGRVQRKRMTCFLLSDFLSPDFSQEAALIAKRHDFIGISIQDAHEHVFPAIGLVQLKDLESQEMRLLDSSDEEVRQHFASQAQTHQKELKYLMQRIGASLIMLDCQEPYVPALRQFFKRRVKKR